MFYAKISRGRTIRNFINGTIVFPIIYSCVWLVVFGGVGIRQEREAGRLGLCCAPKPESNESWFMNVAEIKSQLDDRNLTDLINASEAVWMCKNGTCGSCASRVINSKVQQNTTYAGFVSEYENLGLSIGSTNSNHSVVRPSCHDEEQIWFDVVRSYGKLGEFLRILSLCSIVLYFVTSSDSASLISFVTFYGYVY